MRVRFLIDECLSVSLVAVAKERGVVADHVAYLGKCGLQDWNLVPFAVENDYAVVTNNRRDLLKEYLKLDLHNGLVIIVPAVRRGDQQRFFAKALDACIVEVLGEVCTPAVTVLRPLRSDTPRALPPTGPQAAPSQAAEPAWRLARAGDRTES